MVKNNSVSFWRVIFTVLIALFHFSKLYGMKGGWYISVEFFFITSGFLIMYSYKKNRKVNVENDSAWKFTKHRFSKLYPYYLIVFIGSFIYCVYLLHYNLQQTFDAAMIAIYELLGLQMVGFNEVIYFNAVAWYISVLFIVGYFIYYMLLKHEKMYVQFFIPLSVILIYSFYYRIYGSFEMWGNTESFFQHDALARGLADMNMGILSYVLCEKISQKKWTKLGTIALDLAEVCGFLFIIIVSLFKGNTKCDFAFIIIMSLSVALAFGHRNGNKLFNNKVINYLSGLTFPFYLIHAKLIYRFQAIFPEYNAITIIGFLAGVLVGAIIVDFIVKFVIKVTREKIKPLFIQAQS